MNKSSYTSRARKGRSNILALILLIYAMGSAHFLAAQSDGLPRGAYQMPYERYEAEDAAYSGTLHTSPEFIQSLTASEASNQQYVGLPSNGSSVTFSATEGGQGVTMRFTMPDAPGGDGLNGSLDVYVNGTYDQTVTMSSYWAYQYLAEGSIHPSNNPSAGNKVRMRFDDIHFKLNQNVTPGSSITITKNNGDGIEYGIDFIEVEPVPAAIPKPAGFLDIRDYGAVANDTGDDLPALEACMAAASSAGTGVYIPEGTWYLDYRWIVDQNNITVTGAGIWHTNLYFSNNAQFGGGIYGEAATNVTMGNFYINTVNNDRMDYQEEPSEAPGTPYKIYKAFMGTFAQSYIHDVWQEHFEVGIWMGDYDHNPSNIAEGSTFTRMRIRNNYADGCNFANGSSHCVLEHSNVRNCGDDGMAVWPDGFQTQVFAEGNIFRYNTVEHVYRAGGAALFGGISHEIHHCIIKDGFAGSAIRLTTDFTTPQSPKFATSGLHRIYENTIIGCGTSYDLWNRKRGAIEINVPQGLNNVLFENIDIYNSQRHAINIEGNGFSNVNFNNITVEGTGKDPVVRNIGGDIYGGLAMCVQANSGTITVNKIAMSDIESVNEDGNKDILNRNSGFDLQIIDADIELNGITLASSPQSLLVGQGGQVSIVFNPSNATNKNVTWTNSNPSVASFDAQSLQVVGTGSGSTTITATSVENPSISGSVTLNVSAAVNLIATDGSAGEEGDPGVFTISISDISQDITVGYSLSGSATSGVDYTGSPALGGSITLTASNPSRDIVINPIDDSDFEGAEDIVMTLQPGSGYQLGGNTSAAISITDNENPPCTSPVIGLTANAPANNSTIEASWSEVPSRGIANVTVGGMPGDFSGQWRAMYDNQALYVLVEVADNSLQNDSGSEWWNDDVINIFIDGNNSKGSSYDGLNDFQLGFRWNDPNINVGGNSVSNTTGITFNMFAISGGYALKAAIPWTTIGATPAIGYTIGFDVAVDDDDGGGARDAQVSSFATTEMGWSNPSLFGSVYLTTCEPIVPVAPVINSPLQITRSAGDAINYTIAAANFPTSYSATNLPQGITLNTSTGVMSGTLSTVGTANVTITASNSAGSDTETLQITVNAVAATGVVVSPANMSLTIPQTGQLTASVTPANATDKSVSWASDNTGVATVDSNGLVTAVASGTAVITVTTTDGGHTAQSTISVIAPGEEPPVADPGTGQNISLPMNSTILDGSGSYDPDGNIVTYSWTQVSGPSQATLSGQNTASLSVGNLVVGLYVFQLTVTDNNNLSDAETVSVNVSPESSIPADRGYYDAPYTRYEADASNIGGGATFLPKTFDQKKVEFEASDRSCAKLSAVGSHVGWSLTQSGQGMVLRFSIPDAPGGGGINGTLGIYIDGNKVQDISVTSKWAWQYFSPNPGDGTKDPTNTPQSGWTARMAFDEVRVALPNALPVGTQVRIQKDNSDGIDYLVDFIEMEPIPAALPKPANSLSVTDFGAVPNDGIDDKSAFDACYTAARQEGKGIYFPPGRFDFASQFYLYTDDLAFTGAGMWHTEIYFTNPNPGNGGFNPNATNLTFSDFYMGTENTTRALPYKGFVGYYGTGSVISNVWAEHFEVGAWIANFHGNTGNQDMEIVHCRFRGNYADGVNFSKGTSNSICHHSSFRNNGDDAMASWSSIDGPVCTNNEFAYSTAEHTWRAAGVGFFGGGGHTAHHIIVKDNTEAGLRINSDFQGHTFTGDLIEFHDITVIGSGTNANLWFNRYGAIDIFTRLYNMSNVRFDNIDILDSQKDAIFIYTVNPSYTITNLELSNITIDGTGLDGNLNNYTAGTWDDYAGYAILTDGQVLGDVTLCNVEVQNVASSPAIFQENPNGISLNYCNEVEPTGISVSPTTLSLASGNTGNITATIAPANATNQSVTWTSSNTNVATVVNGVVTAVADGTATITAATYNGHTATTGVTVSTVNTPVTGVSVSPTSATLDIGQGQQLTATISPANATNQNVTWNSANASIATVSSSGLVSAVGAGTVVVTVTSQDGGFTATSTITVNAAPVQTPFGGTPWPIPGTIEAENFDDGGSGVAYSDADATNNGGQGRTGEGVDTELCSEGGLNIGWTSAGEWTEYTVTVSNAGSYDFDFRVASIHSGGTFHVEFNGMNKTGTVTSQNTGAWQNWTTVSVDDVSLEAGQQVMRIAFDNPNHNLDKVIISPSGTGTVPVTGVGVSPASASIAEGATQQLTATVSPGNATNQAVSWASGNAAVATVNSNGLVTGVSEGTATITATTQDGGYTATSTITVTGSSTAEGYYIINRWQQTYLSDGGANVAYSASPAGDNSVWTLEDVGGGHVEVRNAATGEYMHIENLTGRIQCTPRTFGWYSSRWTIEAVDSQYDRIRNAWQGNDYVHVENLVGEAQHGTINSAWLSAQWEFVPVVGSSSRGVAALPELGAPEENRFVIYPNPVVGGKVAVDFYDGTDDQPAMDIIDISGVLLQSQTLQSASQEIDLSGLASGVYFIRIRSGGHTFQQRIIIR